MSKIITTNKPIHTSKETLSQQEKILSDKETRDKKLPPIGLEITGEIPEDVSRIFREVTKLVCEIIQHIILRIRRANEKLRK